ncbi:MAG: AbrB/MazE/SpoVT family DNA-binding domain-containing protein [Pseudoclavibacter sp.]
MSKDALVTGPEGRAFYGSVTVGERGQIVIPAQARRDHGVGPGDKLIVLGSRDGLALMSADRLLALIGDGSPLAAHVRPHSGDGSPAASTSQDAQPDAPLDPGAQLDSGGPA